MKTINTLDKIAAFILMLLGCYGLFTRGDTSWRSAVPYVALVMVSGIRFRERDE